MPRKKAQTPAEPEAPMSMEELEEKILATRSNKADADSVHEKSVPLKLGFGPPPGKVYVFVGSEDDKGETDSRACWYRLGPNNARIWIDHPALTGYITNVRIVPKYWKQKWNYKIDITVLADEEYVIRSGVTTEFSKGVIHALTLVEDFSKPLAIIVDHGSTSKVIFGNVMDVASRKRLFFEGDKAEKLLPLVMQIQERLGVDVQTSDSIKAQIEEEEEKMARS